MRPHARAPNTINATGERGWNDGHRVCIDCTLDRARADFAAEFDRRLGDRLLYVGYLWPVKWAGPPESLCQAPARPIFTPL